MKTTAISAAVALLASVVSAAPAEPAASYTPNAIPITFIGAAEGQFTQYINTNYYGNSICMFIPVPPAPLSHCCPSLCPCTHDENTIIRDWIINH